MPSPLSKPPHVVLLLLLLLCVTVEMRGFKLVSLGVRRASLPSKYRGCLLLQMSSYSSSSSSEGPATDGTPQPQPFRARDVEIPLDKIEFSFARSSGPGGQNVNKLNTKAEIRFHVNSADWLPVPVRQRLSQYQSNKISKDGELIITSQEHRTQAKNKDDCINKLKEMVAEAYVEPKDRQMWEGISEKGKALRRDEKRIRGSVKSSRGRVTYDD